MDGFVYEHYAHTLPGSSDPQDWEPLLSTFGGGECLGDECPACREYLPYHGHSNKVAFWTANYAKALVSPSSSSRDALSQWGYLIGLWHDWGKHLPLWQRYLKTKVGLDLEGDEVSGRVDHSTAGAFHAFKSTPVLGQLFAHMIAGHHAGLPDTVGDNGSLQQRLGHAEAVPAPEEIARRSIPAPPLLLRQRIREGYPTAFFTRMLFSCLVDADFLATEAFMAPERRQERPSCNEALLPAMRDRLQAHLASFGPPQTVVNARRAQVHADCLREAESPQGLFTLTVPTGGGKTLASLAFALKHAILQGQQRIIYVIPFTSIIEQNAAVFRKLFSELEAQTGHPVVLEHHSNLSPERETTATRLAAENWDAPLIVTTAVQFYESLHAAKPGTCRKLHRMANAVVILDEAQCLPVDFLHASLEALRCLARDYHTSVVLCTATPPAINHRSEFPIGLEGVREIVSDPQALYRDLKRVNVRRRGSLSDETLAEELASHSQALAIVNTRGHAQRLFSLLPETGTQAHLSALMCPAHRRKVLEEVRATLKEGEPVTLISTQLIEAGVDIDFPVVYRSMAGIDSIAQAAGRCNRNGELPHRGEMHLFESTHLRSERYFQATANIASEVLFLHEDPLSLEAVETFFSLYYYRHRPLEGARWDSSNILKCFQSGRDKEFAFYFQFREAAEKFRLIDTDQVPVFIPYNEEAKALLRDLRNDTIPLSRSLLRKLQPYAVSIHRPEFEAYRSAFEPAREGAFHLLISPELHYSDHFGLHLQETYHSPTLFA